MCALSWVTAYSRCKSSSTRNHCTSVPSTAAAETEGADARMSKHSRIMEETEVGRTTLLLVYFGSGECSE
jgi:hypothetical protein